jgi:AmpD protein
MGVLVGTNCRFDEKGWFSLARRLDSPNYDARPTGVLPDLLVIHNISLPPEQFGGSNIEQLFTNCLDPEAHPYFAEIVDLRVSSHLLIDREGKVIQFVSLNERAWHAGISSWQGRESCNDYSIGIELEGSDTQAFTESQYQTLVKATEAIQVSFPNISAARIVGHSDIAPGRKTDPGPLFDWGAFRKSVS